MSHLESNDRKQGVGETNNYEEYKLSWCFYLASRFECQTSMQETHKKGLKNRLVHVF